MKQLFARLLVLLAAMPICSLHSAERSDFREKFADVDGVRLHYVEAGQGPVIIFLHGFPEFWYQWKPQLEAFKASYHVVALDMRGYNLSSKPQAVDQYNMKYLVEDVHQLARSLGTKKFVLVGQDWGGVVAWAYALYHPDELSALVVLNAPHPVIFDRELKENPAQQLASQYMITVRGPDAAANLMKDNFAPLINVVLSEGLKAGRFSAEDQSEYVKAWSQPGAIESGLDYYRAAGVGPADLAKNIPAHGNFTPELASTIVKVPTLLIWGLKDPYLLAGNLSGIEKFVPRLKLKLFPDASHWVNHEKPNEVNAAIKEFIGDQR